ncbi:uncharacterized protein LOC143302925 [Bombus vancouverensis nearcticus]|uniref:uncharacterized protein LOC143302925 n=1 Tax=Bombus vancouverensis nearcticus TaxID=2705178 RepID=UPI00402B926A
MQGSKQKLTDKLVNELTVYYDLVIKRNSHCKKETKKVMRQIVFLIRRLLKLVLLRKRKDKFESLNLDYRAPKTSVYEKHTIDIATFTVASVFNDSYKSILSMMQITQLNIEVDCFNVC